MFRGSGRRSTNSRWCGNPRPSILRALAIAVVVLVTLASSGAAARGVRVGIVIDGPVTRADLIETFRLELVELMGEEFGLEVPAEAIVPSDYTAEGVRASLDAMYANPKIDLVIAPGVPST